MELLTLLKQRRIWASIFGAVTLILTVFGANGAFDANVATDAMLKLVEAVSTLIAIGMTLHSYFKPKVN